MLEPEIDRPRYATYCQAGAITLNQNAVLPDRSIAPGMALHVSLVNSGTRRQHEKVNS